ncbi:MAG: DUF6438 domain-containing protein, partial [Paludibacter sp.]|nr:DUF6438 domain-containing protein [Paludibacter sp.]
MRTKNTILFILCLLTLGCTKVNRQDEKLKHLLIGEWEMVREFNQSEKIVLLGYIPFAISFSLDSIEFFNGFYQTVNDTITGKRMSKYCGSFVPYRMQDGDIFIKNIYNNNWEFYGKFINLSNDTLALAIDDTTTVKFSKLSYNTDTIPDFDQIIYSSSGCYGSCPIIDVSVDKNGEVYFQGEGYVSKIGFYNGRINNTKQKYIFDKFRKANPINLLKSYENSWTDDESITTTF